MVLSRTLLLAALLVASASGSRASSRPKGLRTAQEEARNETAVPSFTPQVHEAQRIAAFLGDALLLNNAQRHAVEYCTLAERQALALAATTTDLASAQHQYQLAVHRVLAASQQHAYAVLRRQLSGTNFSLDGTELAVR